MVREKKTVCHPASSRACPPGQEPARKHGRQCLVTSALLARNPAAPGGGRCLSSWHQAWSCQGRAGPRSKDRGLAESGERMQNPFPTEGVTLDSVHAARPGTVTGIHWQRSRAALTAALADTRRSPGGQGGIPPDCIRRTLAGPLSPAVLPTASPGAHLGTVPHPPENHTEIGSEAGINPWPGRGSAARFPCRVARGRLGRYTVCSMHSGSDLAHPRDPGPKMRTAPPGFEDPCPASTRRTQGHGARATKPVPWAQAGPDMGRSATGTANRRNCLPRTPRRRGGGSRSDRLGHRVVADRYPTCAWPWSSHGTRAPAPGGQHGESQRSAGATAVDPDEPPWR